MTSSLYPNVLLSSSVQPSGRLGFTGTGIYQDLDSSLSSYVFGGGAARFAVGIEDHPTMTDVQLASVTVQFEARPEPGFSTASGHPLNAEMYDTATGQIYARSFWIYGGNTSFATSTISFGSIIGRAALNRSAIRVFSSGSDLVSELWDINDLHVVVTALFNGPTASATGPAGALADNTPTVQFTITVDDPATETVAYARIRVFNDDQYTAGGFNPETSPALWDSGLRAAGSLAITTIVLPPDNYRAYVAGVQQVSPGRPWVGTGGGFGTSEVGSAAPSSQPVIVYQTGPFASFTAFSIVSAAPASLGPTIRVDAVRDLTDDQRIRIAEPFQPLPRVSLFTADGVFVRDLDIVSGTVTLDAKALVRGQLTLTCTDTDIVPSSSGASSGELLPFHPFGSYIHVCYGAQLGRFEQVFVGIGVFRLTNVKADRVKGLVTAKAKDFSLNLQEARFGQDTSRQNWDAVPPTPFTVLETARDIITEAGLAYRTPTASSASVVQNYINKRGDDRAKALQGLANSVNLWTHYADIDGVIYFGLGPDITVDPITYTFNDADPTLGRLTAQIIDRDEELTRDDIYDVVIASNQAGTVVGGAYDSNPNSIVRRSAAIPGALYIGAGPFSPGGKPYFFASPIVTDQPGSEAAARTLFADVALPADTIKATCDPIPDLRPDKMVAMPRTPNGPIEKWQITSVELPLGIGPPMTWEAVTLATATDPAS